jgi:uncharacterized membrane protein YiaA
MSGVWIAEMTRLRERGYEVRFLEVLINFSVIQYAHTGYYRWSTAAWA